MAERATFVEDTRPYGRLLYSTAVRLTTDPVEAEDLLQETFLRAYRSYDTFQVGTNLRAWLFRILSNANINRHRARQRRPEETELDDLDDPAFHRRSVEWYRFSRSAEDELLEQLSYRDVTAAVHSLAPAYRSAVLLADIEGLSYREIADALHIPIGTVMSRLHRGRTVLRRQLRDHARSQGLRAAADRPRPAAVRHVGAAALD
jgi:RNA polymerase sigma-70 factor (ECF subfamily)